SPDEHQAEKLQPSTYVFRWGDIQALLVEGFMIPIVKPQGPAPQLPTFEPDSSVDVQDNQDIIDDASAPAERIHQSLKIDVSGNYPVMCGNYEMRAGGGGVKIQTPYYPANYIGNFKCKWKLTVFEGEGLLIDCPKFQLNAGDTLTTMVIGKPWTLKRYQWRKGPSNQELLGSTALISFLSNRKKHAQGFTCSVTILRSSTTESTTELTTSSTTTTTTRPTTTTTTTTTTKAAKPNTTPTTTTTTTATTTTTTTNPTTSLPPLSHPDCGIANRNTVRVVNGQAASPNEYPWQSFLEIKWNDGKNQLCGGSLITNQWILTAGHCVLSNCLPIDRQGSFCQKAERSTDKGLSIDRQRFFLCLVKCLFVKDNGLFVNE
ncbi:hypothetical protein SK128_010319, partial [Halocaridina rubra]